MIQCERLRYEKQTCPLDSFRLLQVKILYEGEILKNDEYKGRTQSSIPDH